jgi:hypothetical protein
VNRIISTGSGSLTGIVCEDDSQIAVLHLYRDYDKMKPRIQVTLQ